MASAALTKAPANSFYDKLNKLLRSIEFDEFVERICEPYYAKAGRPGIAPGVYFRMTLIGYFEGIDSQRGIAWRCQDSLSLRRFLGVALDENTPVHASMTHIRQRLPLEIHEAVFNKVLSCADAHQLVSGQVGIDSTTVEANASMKSIKRRDTFEDYPEFVERLMREAGEIEEDETPSAEERARFDRARKGKKLSNKDWKSSTDPDARIGRMKNGSTRLMYKAEHAVDLDSGVVLSAQIHHGDESDTQTLGDTVASTAVQFKKSAVAQGIHAVVADKGYHTLAQLEALQELGVRVYVATPSSKNKRIWANKSPEAKRAFDNNARRCKGDYGKSLHRKRGELVERSFAHVCTTGGARRAWLRGLENINKRYTIVAAAHNLAAIMRALFGVGKPKEWVDKVKEVFALLFWSIKVLSGALRAYQSAIVLFGWNGGRKSRSLRMHERCAIKTAKFSYFRNRGIF